MYTLRLVLPCLELAKLDKRRSDNKQPNFESGKLMGFSPSVSPRSLEVGKC